uniref:Uncharacterized protein n=1 Tax=Arundo donax TaxID=35708 RepID=A0A0A8XXL8_ARUDO
MARPQGSGGLAFLGV